MVNPWDRGDPLLHAILAYGGGHSTLDAVMSTCEQPGSEVIAAFAAPDAPRGSGPPPLEVLTIRS